MSVGVKFFGVFVFFWFEVAYGLAGLILCRQISLTAEDA